jgi:hypothetical protein
VSPNPVKRKINHIINNPKIFLPAVATSGKQNHPGPPVEVFGSDVVLIIAISTEVLAQSRAKRQQ